MKRILVTGASGMLGSYLANYLKADYDVYAAGNSYFDQQFEKYLKFDLKSNCYKELINWSKPEFVVHCAAMTNGNECEKNPQVANLVNGYSVKKLCSSVPSETTIIYISSDAVFSPSLVMANEENEPKPESSYGKSKLLGENYLNDLLQNYYIIRTTIVGTNINRNKKSFVDWIIDSSLNRKTISLFDDVIFNPIAIWDLCCELKFIIESKIDPGTYHISGSEPISKYDFGIKILNELNYSSKNIVKGSIDDFEDRAKRSKDQTLDSSKYTNLTGRELPNINETIASFRLKLFV